MVSADGAGQAEPADGQSPGELCDRERDRQRGGIARRSGQVIGQALHVSSQQAQGPEAEKSDPKAHDGVKRQPVECRNRGRRRGQGQGDGEQLRQQHHDKCHA